MVGEEMGRLRILWPRWLNRNDWPCGAQYVANVTAGRWWHKMHVSSAFVLQGKGRYSGMSISQESKCSCITASYEPQHASIWRIICHNLMFICGIYFKKRTKGHGEFFILLRKAFVECDGMHSASFTKPTALGQTATRLRWFVCSKDVLYKTVHTVISVFPFFLFYPSFQDTMFRVRCLRRGWGGRVVTSYRRFMTTSRSCTQTLKKTALTQVRLNAAIFG